jgi:cell division protein FtsA
MAGAKERMVAVLDVGTSKVACLIAAVTPGEEPRVVGVGHQLCLGLNAGMVTNMQKTEKAIRAAMDQAEKSAGRQIDRVSVAIASAGLCSDVVTVNVDINGHAVEQTDLERVLSEGRAAIDAGARTVLHAQPACYTIDGAEGIRNPLGMYGEKLGVDINVITAEAGPVRNLETCVREAHLHVGSVVAAPVAAGLGCLSDDERQLGVALVEIGSGVTTVSVFAGGFAVGCSTIMMGAGDVTDDIARTLMTPLSHAERLKTLYGTVVTAPTDNHEMLEVAPASRDDGIEPYRISRAQLAGIIRQRLEVLFSEVAARLDDLGFKGPCARQIVLTGGGSQLPGINHFAQTLLNKSVRTGRPVGLRGLPEAAAGPAFATLVGLVHHAVKAPEDARFFSSQTRVEIPRSRLSRMVRWIRATA